MAKKSLFSRLAKGIGRATGQVLEKAREKGLDEKAEELWSKARAAAKDLADEFEDGKREACDAATKDEADVDGGGASVVSSEAAGDSCGDSAPECAEAAESPAVSGGGGVPCEDAAEDAADDDRRRDASPADTVDERG